MLFPALVSALIVSTVLCAKLIAKNEIQTYLDTKKDIVAFYNVYAQGNDYNGVVQNQVNTIKGSGLLDMIDNVYYATMGSAGKDYDIGNNEKYVHIDHYGDEGTELQTLSLLHRFCRSNPESKVLYFHDKGSYHHTYANAKFCSVLNCYVLNPHCIEALDTHDTCGWRISPTPHPHYSGNFWWARCAYVNTLIDPMAPINNQTFIEEAKALPCSSLDSHSFAETWVGTGPTILPADCMNSTVDDSYLWGYRFPYTADAYCHGAEKPSGLPCQTASTLVDAEQFRNAIVRADSLIPQEACRNNRAEITKRSFMMYGEAPHSYLDWMEKIFAVVKPPEGDLIRFTDGAQVYIARSGVLRGVPNLQTFMTFGRDFDEVKVVYASEKNRYSIGDMLPSV